MRPQLHLRVLALLGSLAVCIVFTHWGLEVLTDAVLDLRRGYCIKSPWLHRRACCASSKADGGLASLTQCPAWHDWGTPSPTELTTPTTPALPTSANPFPSTMQPPAAATTPTSTANTTAERDTDDDESYNVGDHAAYIVYVASSVLLCYAAAQVVASCGYISVGSGVTEVRVVLGGYDHSSFLGMKTFLSKIVGLLLAVGGGLSLGIEAPMVHIACCIADALWRHFPSTAPLVGRKELLTAAGCAGLAVAFGAPVTGLVFGLEELSPLFPTRCMLPALVTAVVGTLVRTMCRGSHWLQVDYDFEVHDFEIPAFLLLAAICGATGAAVVRMNTAITQGFCAWRLRPALYRRLLIIEVVVIAFFTSFVRFWNPYTRAPLPMLLSHLFSQCDTSTDADWHGLCNPHLAGEEIWLVSTAAFALVVLTTVTIGACVPGGALMPLLAAGACMGRVMGLVMQQLQYYHSSVPMFGACLTTNRCITPGVYAMMGGASLVTAATRTPLTASVLMFEVTGELRYTIPILCAAGVARAVANRLCRLSLWDTYTQLWGYPHIDLRDNVQAAPSSVIRKATVTDVMLEEVGAVTGLGWDPDLRLREHCAGVAVVHDSGATVRDLVRLCRERPHKGYPVVLARQPRMVIGYVRRSRLLGALKHARQQGASDKDRTLLQSALAADDLSSFKFYEGGAVDLSSVLESGPTLIEWGTPLHVIHSIFKYISVQCVVVVKRGSLCGVVNRSDVLRFLQAHEHDGWYATDDTEAESAAREMSLMGEDDDTDSDDDVTDRLTGRNG